MIRKITTLTSSITGIIPMIRLATYVPMPRAPSAEDLSGTPALMPPRTAPILAPRQGAVKDRRVFTSPALSVLRQAFDILLQGAVSTRAVDQLGMFGRDLAPMSPVRRQYLEQKQRHPDAILFFRLGDFYETFEDDAETIARELEIVLTSRELGRGERLPMAGVPAAAVDSYVARLIARGYRVAICEQLSEPNGRGPVQRGVTRVVSPGTLVEDSLLSPRESSFLAALLLEGQRAGLAYLDASTGLFAVTEVGGPQQAIVLQAELQRIDPAECLLFVEASASQQRSDQLADQVAALLPARCRPTLRSAELVSPRRAGDTLRRQFDLPRLDALGLEETPLAARAAAALLDYLAETLPAALVQFDRLQRYDVDGAMLLDASARRNLELLAGLRSGTREGSLLEVVDRTGTPMGARLLRRWLAQPLLDRAAIERRLDAIERLVARHDERAQLAELLASQPDLERLAGRVFQARLSPRDGLALARGLAAVPEFQRALQAIGIEPGEPLDPVEPAQHLLRERLADEPPALLGPGTIRPGYSADLDELRALSGDTRRWIADLERRERERTGLRGLKVGHNRVSGYYLEVSQATTRQPTDYYQQQQTGAADVGQHLEKLVYVRKQTLAGAERYITPELKEYELKASRAEQEADRLERRLFTELLEALRPLAARIMASARALAETDCLTSLATVGQERGYVRPELDESCDLVIEAGRHPIVEAALEPGAFVPNDAELTQNTGRIQVVTGPNMAGKSTVLRTVALIALMAQCGSFVPARRARIGLVDRIFTRIGAQDDLAGHRSTFMVEMTEAASVLRSATPRSLVVLDELGRGTSTYDGLALARAILEHLHDDPRLGCRTLFATHYHELAGLEAELSGVRSLRMEVLEQGREVVFLHRLVPGAADRSYGIHVARLAGVPPAVTARAEAILADLEASHASPEPRRGRVVPPPRPTPGRVALERLRALDPLNLTPFQALEALQQLRDLLDQEDASRESSEEPSNESARDLR
jgi:DNA mismatch repair protein MutS